MLRPRIVLSMAALVVSAVAWTVAFADAGGMSPRRSASTHGGVMATLERTPCFGTCPDYKVVVYRDGTVEYDGRNFVKVHGARRARLAPATLAALERAFLDAHYFALRSDYTRREVTDMPSCNTSFSDGKRTKTIAHYAGDSGAPKSLGMLEKRFDALVHVEKWVGRPDERREGGTTLSPSL